MDEQTIKTAEDIWKRISKHKTPEDHQIEIEIYQKMLNLFQVGDYCYLIFCPAKMSVEFCSESVEKVFGYPPELFSLEKFMDMIHPEDMPNFINFEATVTQFWLALPPDKVFKYKSRYDLRVKLPDDSIKRLLQQVVVIQSDEEGAVLRTFVTYTDITHLKQNDKMVLSIMGLDGEPSYINIQPVEQLKPYRPVLSKREIHILRLMVTEHHTRAIAEKLNISPHTVATHRKNIFRKTKTNSVLQLIKLGLEKGWI